MNVTNSSESYRLPHIMKPTERLYWQDDHCTQCDSTIVGVREGELAFDRTCFYPGGGGQPPDDGHIVFSSGESVPITGARADEDGIVWHTLSGAPSTVVLGDRVRIAIHAARRLALARYHTVLHVLNTIALQDYAAWITGAQIGVDYSRIDFRWEGFSPALTQDLERKVNTVLERACPLRAYYLTESEFQGRPDLLRTLEVKPPVIGGRVRVVEIEGFDAQACGGTHVPTTADVGRCSIYKTENKGRINKRLYVRLDPPQ
jgi:misacylated tRNA(Ala) deacylase